MRSDAAARALSTAFRAGALYDWVLGLVILAAHPEVFRLFRIPPPGDLFYFRTNSLVLFLLGLYYWEIGRDPGARRWAAWTAVAARFGGGALLLVLALAHRPPGTGLFLAFAGIDFLWGALWFAQLTAIKNPPSQGDDSG